MRRLGAAVAGMYGYAGMPRFLAPKRIAVTKLWSLEKDADCSLENIEAEISKEKHDQFSPVETVPQDHWPAQAKEIVALVYTGQIGFRTGSDSR